MDLEGHRDQPEWLSHVNASVLKVKLGHGHHRHQLNSPASRPSSTPANYEDKVLIAQTAIHITFLLSAMAIAYTDRLMVRTQNESQLRIGSDCFCGWSTSNATPTAPLSSDPNSTPI